MPNRTRLMLLALIALLLAPPAFAQSGNPVRVIAPVLALPDPVTLAPTDLDGRDLAENLYAGLFRYDAAARAAVPVLAQTWSTDADGLTWTFNLRGDVAWVRTDAAGGQVAALRPVQAADFVYALRRACHPLKPSPATPAIYVIAGCRMALHADPLTVTDAAVEAWVRVEAPDPSTLVLHLAFPAAYLPALLTLPEFRPLAPEAVEGRAGWSMVSSGPYVIAAWTPGQAMTLVRSPFWPEPLPGNAERVDIAFNPDPAARADAFAHGEADFARLPAEGASLPGAQVRRGAAVTLLGFSTERAFVRDVKARQALAWSLDRDALAAALGPGRALPALTLTDPAAIAGPPADAGIGFQPEAARAALAEAGYPDCGGVPERLTILVPERAAPLAEALIAGWAAALGCDPNLFQVQTGSEADVQSFARHLLDAAETEAVRPHLWIAPWEAFYPDAQAGAADVLQCRYGAYVSGLGCTPLDDLIERAGWGTPPEERPGIYALLEARYFGPGGEYPAVPLLASAEVIGVGPSLRGVQAAGPMWWGAWVNE